MFSLFLLPRVGNGKLKYTTNTTVRREKRNKIEPPPALVENCKVSSLQKEGQVAVKEDYLASHGRRRQLPDRYWEMPQYLFFVSLQNVFLYSFFSL